MSSRPLTPPCVRFRTRRFNHIECMDLYASDISYANHYATIKKWLDEDSKGRSAKNYTYDDNEGECL